MEGKRPAHWTHTPADCAPASRAKKNNTNRLSMELTDELRASLRALVINPYISTVCQGVNV
jgi:hypothetical protein